MTPPGNTSSSGGAAEPQCVVNDKMVAFTVCYVLLFMVAVPGNLLSAWAFVRCRRTQLKQTCGVYLLNLLLADLLLLLALPFKILKDASAAPWNLLVFHCQVSAVIIYISLYASIAFLALIITDRYLQDCAAPVSLRLQEVGFSWLLSLVVWLLLLIIMVPNMALPTQQVQVQPYLQCSSLKKDLGVHWHALTVFLNTALFLNASAAVLVSCFLALRRFLRGGGGPERQLRAKRAVLSMTAMAAAFVLSFVPYHAVRTPYTLAQTKLITDCQTTRRLFLGKEATLLLSALHLCCDPLLCFYLSAPYRRAVRSLLPGGRMGEEGGEQEQEEREQEENTVTMSGPSALQVTEEFQQVQHRT
ncbi:probable G-protein coupled receptor 171 [Salarias fasciatus]|uniref:Probable G-protein coupled receptor 171 n=1 Tax=Salarias fasciatus TaxID=181472 RepID=A0A672H7L5_SALFA|nr:probable G-protein coupled receptor 171 [Salarias fasciatus]